MGGIQVRVRLDGAGYSAFIARLANLSDGELHTLTVADCHKGYFRELYGDWLEQHRGQSHEICESVRIEGYAGQQRYLVATFGDQNHDCAMLFKLTFGGAL